jgi:hypothetical protein
MPETFVHEVPHITIVYWAVLYAWENDQRARWCKVPFRVYDGNSKFWACVTVW